MIRFGNATWDPQARRLTVGGRSTILPFRSAACLDVLLEADGAPVSREALRDAVWGDAVVEDSNLAHSILVLRRALDPAPDGSSYIETLPRIGYRLTTPRASTNPGPVDDASSAASAPDGMPPPVSLTAHQTGRSRRIAAALLTVAALCAVAVGLASRTEESSDVTALVDEGLRLVRRGNAGDGIRGADLIEQALAREPESSYARAAMAEVATRLGNHSFDTAIDLATAAVRTSPSCGECHAILGYILMTRSWKWAEAGRHLDEGVASSRNPSQALIWRGLWLAVQGRYEEARRDADGATVLAPASAAARGLLGTIAFFDGRYEDALRLTAESAQLNPTYSSAHYFRMRTYMALEDDLAAANARVDYLAAWSGFDATGTHNRRLEFGGLLDRGGRVALVDAWLAEVSAGAALATHRYERATWQMWAGRTEAALDEIEGAVRDRPFNVVYAAVDPAFATIRDLPRFRAVLQALGLAANPGHR